MTISCILPMGHSHQVIRLEAIRDIQAAVIENKPLSDEQRLVVDAMASFVAKNAPPWIDEQVSA